MEAVEKRLAKIAMTGMTAVLLAAGAWAIDATAAGRVNEAYIRSLAAPGKAVLVVEYYDAQKNVRARKGFASATGFKPSAPTEIAVDTKTRLRLFGLEPCSGEMVNQKEGFAGTCSDYAEQQLAILLKSPKVLLCRAFLTEENRPVQDATCFGYYNYPGSLDTIDNLEEQLVSLGALRVVKKADGSPLRSDLMDAEKIGRGGFGMWADPRVRAQ